MSVSDVFVQPGVPAFTVKQPDGSMKVLQERAEEIGVRIEKTLETEYTCSSFHILSVCPTVLAVSLS